MTQNATARYTASQSVQQPFGDVSIVQDGMKTVDPVIINRALSWSKNHRQELLKQSDIPVEAPAVTNPKIPHSLALMQINGVITTLYARLAASSPSQGYVPYDPNGTVSKFFDPSAGFTIKDVQTFKDSVNRGDAEGLLLAIRQVSNFAREATYLQAQAGKGDIDELSLPAPERSYSTLINIIARASTRLETAQKDKVSPSPIQIDRKIWMEAKKASDYDEGFDSTLRYLEQNKALLIVDIVPRKKAESSTNVDIDKKLAELRAKPPTPEIIRQIAELTRKRREQR